MAIKEGVGGFEGFEIIIPSALELGICLLMHLKGIGGVELRMGHLLVH